MKNIKSIMMLILMLIISSAPAYAHKMTIEPVEEGVVKVIYDDGSFSSRTEVTVYDSEDQVIESGKLNDKGEYTYDASKDVAYIVADDGMGHKDEWESGQEVETNSGGSKAIKIGLVLMVLGGVGGFSYTKRDKAKKDS